MLLDPPYAPAHRADLMPSSAAAGVVSPADGIVVLEHARRATAPDASGASGPHAQRNVGRFGVVVVQLALATIMSTLAVYPGSFDPLTNGHVDIITRGARLFDRIIVAILVNAEKSPLFTMAERVEIARAVFNDQPNVEVDTFDGLLVDYVERRQAQVIVRGLRAVSDFEFEFQMALMNRRLKPKIETVFMMPAEQYTYISSRLIKEVFALGGRVHGLVPGHGGRAAAREEAKKRSAESEGVMPRLAERTSRIASSPTMKVTATVDRLRREGVEVIDFGAGEPDFGTPAAINAAAHAAIEQHFTKYTPVAGTRS